MLDIKLIRENPELVRENMRKKFKEDKISLVDEVLALDAQNRAIKGEVEALRAERNRASKLIGGLMGRAKKGDEAAAAEAQAKGFSLKD